LQYVNKSYCCAYCSDRSIFHLKVIKKHSAMPTLKTELEHLNAYGNCLRAKWPGFSSRINRAALSRLNMGNVCYFVGQFCGPFMEVITIMQCRNSAEWTVAFPCLETARKLRTTFWR